MHVQCMLATILSYVVTLTLSLLQSHMWLNKLFTIQANSVDIMYWWPACRELPAKCLNAIVQLEASMCVVGEAYRL